MRVATLVLLAACGSDLRTQTKLFVAPAPCGQGPYDVHLVVDGKTGEEGVEVVACTPHALAGHVEVRMKGLTLISRRFGDVADNQRCTGGAVTTVTAAGSGEAGAATPGPAGGVEGGAAPALVEWPYSGSETPIADDLCKPFGMPAQTIVGTVTMRTDFLHAGDDLHLRIWSDAPMDLQGAVFLIRHVTSTKSLAQVEKDDEKWEREHAHDPPPKDVAKSEPASHGPPPAALAEQRPPRPTPGATWIAGYWTWTGTAWGWSAGFWRDDRVAMPAPQIETPGAPPAPAAVWVTGSWQVHAGAWVWIHGRWR